MRDGNESNSGNGSGDGNGNGNADRIRNGKESNNREGRGGGEEPRYPPHREISRVEYQALPFRTRCHICRQAVVSEDRQ